MDWRADSPRSALVLGLHAHPGHGSVPARQLRCRRAAGHRRLSDVDNDAEDFLADDEERAAFVFRQPALQGRLSPQRRRQQQHELLRQPGSHAQHQVAQRPAGEVHDAVALELRHRRRLRAAERRRPVRSASRARAGAISRFDANTNTFTHAWPTYNFNLHKRDQAHASISYFAGNHDIRAGYSIFVNGKPSAIWSTSAMRAQYRSGQPELVNTYNVAIYDPATARDVETLFTQGNREQGYYVQDKWTPTRKLVINYGVRFESNYGWQDATCQPVTVFFNVGKCYDAIKGAPDLKNVLPRFAAVYDLHGRWPDGDQVRREPVQPADPDGVRRTVESGRIGQRHPAVAAAEPVQRSQRARVRPQRRPRPAARRARSVGRLPQRSRVALRR